MKNYLDKLDSSFISGVDHIEKDDEGIVFKRFNSEVKAFYNTFENLSLHSSCTASVCIKLKSKTTELNVAFKVLGASRSNYTCNLVVDGVQTTFGPTKGNETNSFKTTIFKSQDKMERTFEIWLSCFSNLKLIKLECNDEVYSVKPLEKKWLFFGDSITQGVETDVPLHSFANRVVKKLNCECHNVAVAGATLTSSLTKFNFKKYSVVSIAYGANDFNQNVSIDLYRENLKKLIQTIKEKNVTDKIICISPLYWVGREGEKNGKGHTLEDYRSVANSVSKEYDEIVTFIDGKSLIPEEDMFFTDKVHPNEVGFAVYADKFLEQIEF